MRSYKVEGSNGDYYLVSIGPNLAKSVIARKFGEKYTDLRVTEYDDDGCMQPDKVYLMTCETCGLPCMTQYVNGDLESPLRSIKAKCEHCRLP